MVSLAPSFRRTPPRRLRIDPHGILNALPDPVIVVDGEGVILYVNFEAQQFFEAGENALVGRPLSDLVPAHTPLLGLIAQVFQRGSSCSEYGVSLETPRFGPHVVKATAAPMGDPVRFAVLTLHEVSLANRIDNQLAHRHAARSVTAMARMLAHEVKNPLSGIRGAAQLLEQTGNEQDGVLTRLICDEADRIVALVDRMEVFSDSNRISRKAVNIHHVLDRVRKVAENGFARHVRIVERYDPSLPPVYGDHDQLVQVFLNLVKNAAEAVPDDGGEVALTTAYQRGVAMTVPGTGRKVMLPLAVSVRDNGDGIPEDLHQHLFDPFVTTKKNGSGLGLALVAKIVGDHGGVIGFESQAKRTVFKVSLPVYSADEDDAEAAAEE
jgi:two-component system nitrogen regulation sensor histidine kinase GlnL